ncbi:MAG TPA: hypothetical protein VNN62_08200 [Methylomirabilota bacterium]|nr:hypothetical protein [Methylomirabilota bacterium]
MFFLRHEWRDAEEGVETVLLHWTTTRIGQEPNWKRSHNTTVMLPQAGADPGLRVCSVWVAPPFPWRQILTTESSERLCFLLHSFCEVIQRGRLWSTEATQQEIRATPVRHRDDSGEYTQAVLYYTLDGFTHMNCLPMWLDGAPRKDQRLPSLPEHRPTEQEIRTWARRDRLVAQLPLPHLFRGYIWGPVGARALYSVYLRRQGAYNPFTEGGFWLLRNGRPWEVRL